MRRVCRFRLLLPAAAGLLCACQAPVVSSDGPTVDVGTGDAVFLGLLDGQTVEMTHGPQGGWHIMGAVRTVKFEAIIEIHYTVTVDAPDRSDIDGAIVADQSYRVMSIEDPDDPTVHTFPGLYGYLDVSDLAEGDLDTPPELLSYQTVIMRMEVADDVGNAAADQVAVTAEPDPDDIDMVP